MEIMEPAIEVDPFTTAVTNYLQDLLTRIGVPETGIEYTKLVVALLLVVGAVYLLQFITKAFLTFVFRMVHRYAKLPFFSYLTRNKLPKYLAYMVPYTFVRSAIPVIFNDFPGWIRPMVKIADSVVVFIVLAAVMSLIKSFFNVLHERTAFRHKPMRSYIQVIYIVLFIVGCVTVFSIVSSQSPKVIFTAMGAASAILLLVFQDSIKGFVGSIQVNANDMVQIGDWITMNKYGADGDVEDITLTTVKIRNFDKTITTIPTYALISDSFQNWRGMRETGGRRFKRALNIKQSSIRFMDGEELEKFGRMAGLKDYVAAKKQEYGALNAELGENIHRITNNDLYLQYVLSYLRSHPKIHKNLTIMVRQLAPTEYGVPVELYTFTNTTAWTEYEVILSEIINHCISVTPVFGVEIYEMTSGSDICRVQMEKS